MHLSLNINQILFPPYITTGRIVAFAYLARWKGPIKYNGYSIKIYLITLFEWLNSMGRIVRARSSSSSFRS